MGLDALEKLKPRPVTQLSLTFYWRFQNIQYCAKVMQAKCANFVLCSRELSSESSLENLSVNLGRFERNFA